jgi:hypothetical protein
MFLCCSSQAMPNRFPPQRRQFCFFRTLDFAKPPQLRCMMPVSLSCPSPPPPLQSTPRHPISPKLPDMMVGDWRHQSAPFPHLCPLAGSAVSGGPQVKGIGPSPTPPARSPIMTPPPGRASSCPKPGMSACPSRAAICPPAGTFRWSRIATLTKPRVPVRTAVRSSCTRSDPVGRRGNRPHRASGGPTICNLFPAL